MGYGIFRSDIEGQSMKIINFCNYCRINRVWNIQAKTLQDVAYSDPLPHNGAFKKQFNYFQLTSNKKIVLYSCHCKHDF